MDFEQFSKLVDDIMAQGYDEDTACEYAALLGDTIPLDEEGRWLVVDQRGNVLARLTPLH